MRKKFPTTERNRVRRVARLANYDREEVFRVIDATWVAQVGIEGDDSPVVIPMLHARVGESLLFHGAKSSRLVKYLASGQPICVSFAVVDGLVLAKSLFHHSMNYRSAVVFGRGTLLSEPDAIIQALQAISDKTMPGRWTDARFPSEKELSATAVVQVKIESASAKCRTGGPKDDAEDLSLPVWSGVVPFRSIVDEPIPDSHTEVAVPQYVSHFRNRINLEQK